MALSRSVLRSGSVPISVTLLFLLDVSLALLEIGTGANSSSIQIPAYVANQYLGAPVGDYTVTGTLRKITGDPCRHDTDQVAADLTGQVVLISQDFACADFIPYDIFASRNATAILRNVTRAAGQRYTMRSLYDHRDRPEPRRTDPLYVDVLWTRDSPVNVSLMYDGMEVSVRADLSPWVPVLLSWWFQLGSRWVSSVLYLAAFALSVQYLGGHIALVLIADPARNKSGLRLLAHLFASVTLIHVALFLGIVKNGVMMLQSLLGAWQTQSTFPYELQLYLATNLVGLENSISIITARYWHQVISKSDALSKSHLWGATFAAVLGLCAIVSDSSVGFVLATYQHLVNPGLLTFGAVIQFVYTFFVTVYFTSSLIRFRLQVRRSSQPRTSTNNQHLERFVSKLSRRAGLQTVSMTSYLLLVAAYAGSRVIQGEPIGFGLFSVVFNVICGLRAIFSIFMLQPRNVSGSKSSAAGTFFRKTMKSIASVGARSKSKPSRDQSGAVLTKSKVTRPGSGDSSPSMNSRAPMLHSTNLARTAVDSSNTGGTPDPSRT